MLGEDDAKRHIDVLKSRPCPVCAEPTVNPFASLIWPRCKVCRSKFKLRLPIGIGFIGDYVGHCVLLGSIAVAVFVADTWAFVVGVALFTVLEVTIFRVSRLEPDTRDPVTVMQLRRYSRA